MLALLIIFSSSREVREQSLSRRDLTDPPPNTPPPGYRPPNTPPPGYRPPGYRPPGYPPQEPETKPMLPGNTVPSDREQLGPPPTDVPPPRGSNAKPLHIKIKVNTAPAPKKTFMPPKGSNARQYLTNFLVGTAATMTGATILKWITGSSGFSSSAPSSSANQNSQSNSYPPPASYTSSSTPSGQYGSGVGAVGPGQYQNQQRDVDHGKRAGSFGELHSSHGL